MRTLSARWAARLLGLGGAIACIGAANPPKKGAERLLDPGRVDGRATPRAHSLPPSEAPIQIRVGTYHGWERSLTLSNGKVEAVVVPAVGRVMQFNFRGEPSPFWEDPTLYGRSPDPTASEWGNFGGDKTWPAPQADWPKVTPRAWPPPVAFDALPAQSSIRRDAVVLTSAVDPHYGIQIERVVRLDWERPVMSISTTYQKVEGDPVKVGIWIITQLDDPVAVFAAVPRQSLFPDGYNRQSGTNLPAGLKVDGNLLSLTRDPRQSTKIGTDGDRLLWVGQTRMLLIESPRVSGGEYPDQQSSAEIYTNPDPKAYVELEMLGPLHDLKVGDRLSFTNTYTLLKRTGPAAEREARRVLGR